MYEIWITGETEKGVAAKIITTMKATTKKIIRKSTMGIEEGNEKVGKNTIPSNPGKQPYEKFWLLWEAL